MFFYLIREKLLAKNFDMFLYKYIVEKFVEGFNIFLYKCIIYRFVKNLNKFGQRYIVYKIKNIQKKGNIMRKNLLFKFIKFIKFFHNLCQHSIKIDFSKLKNYNNFKNIIIMKITKLYSLNKKCI